MDLSAEEFASKPYILYITDQQEVELRKYIKLKKWKIRIFICIHPDNRPTLNSLLTEEPKENSNQVSDNSDVKTFQVNDFVFKQVSMFEHIHNVHNFLSPHIDKIEDSKTADLDGTQERGKRCAKTSVLKIQKKCKVTSHTCKSLDRDRHRLLMLWKEARVPKSGDTNGREIKNDCLNNKNSISKQATHEEPSSVEIDILETSDIHNYLEDNADVEMLADTSSENDYQSEAVIPNTNKVTNLERNRVSRHMRNRNVGISEWQGKAETGTKIHEIAADFNDIHSNGKKKSKDTSSKLSTTKACNRFIRRKRKPVKKDKSNGKLKSFSERWSTLKCNICGRAFASEKFYERHMKIKHSVDADGNICNGAIIKKKKVETNNVHVCSVCQKQFCDKYGLQSHMKHIHNNDMSVYQCDLCGAVLKFKGSLVQHMKSVHTDERPHHCNICNKRFKVLHQLKNHQRRHDPDHIDTCTICGKTVKKGQLSGHIKRHRDDKKHVCTTCDKKFFEKQDLHRHQRIHSGEKPFKCSFCTYACAIKGNLTKHIIHKHRKDPYSPESPNPEQPYYNVTNRTRQPVSQPPIEEETTTVYVLESTEPDIEHHSTHMASVDGTTRVHEVEQSNNSVYSILNTSTTDFSSMSLSQGGTKHYVSDTLTDMSKSVHNASTAPCDHRPIYQEEPNVYYSMRPVMSLSQSVGQSMSSSSATRVIEASSQFVDGQVIGRDSFSYACNERNNPDARYSYTEQQ